MRMSSEISMMSEKLDRLEQRLSGSSVESLMSAEPAAPKKRSVRRPKEQTGPKPGFGVTAGGLANALGNLKKTGVDPKYASKKVRKNKPDVPKPPPNGEKESKRRRRRSRRT